MSHTGECAKLGKPLYIICEECLAERIQEEIVKERKRIAAVLREKSDRVFENRYRGDYDINVAVSVTVDDIVNELDPPQEEPEKEGEIKP